MSHVISSVVLVLALLGQDFDKSRHSWMKFKTGSSASYKMTLEMGPQAMEITSKSELKEVTDKGYTLVETAEMMGNKNESERSTELPKKDGEETLKIDGKEYKCTIWKESSTGARERETRMWIADGVDGPLKITSKGDNEETELLAVKVKDEVEAAGKKLSCVKLEGTFKSQMGEMKGAAWLSLDVPGGMVKLSLEGEQGKMKAELTEFDVKK